MEKQMGKKNLEENNNKRNWNQMKGNGTEFDGCGNNRRQSESIGYCITLKYFDERKNMDKTEFDPEIQIVIKITLISTL